MNTVQKFNILDKVKVIKTGKVFIVTEMHYDFTNKQTKLSCFGMPYLGESELELYIEPKKQLILQEYLVKTSIKYQSYVSAFFENDELFKKYYIDCPIIKTGRSVEASEQC